MTICEKKLDLHLKLFLHPCLNNKDASLQEVFCLTFLDSLLGLPSSKLTWLSGESPFFKSFYCSVEGSKMPYKMRPLLVINGVISPTNGLINKAISLGFCSPQYMEVWDPLLITGFGGSRQGHVIEALRSTRLSSYLSVSGGKVVGSWLQLGERVRFIEVTPTTV